MHFRCLSGRTCHRNGRVVRTWEPWEGEGSERDVSTNHEELESDTSYPKHVHGASTTNTYKQRPLTCSRKLFAVLRLAGMHPSFRVAHRPLISFIGKRQWPPGLCRFFFSQSSRSAYSRATAPAATSRRSSTSQGNVL